MGYERKDFDEKMNKIIQKTENEHQIKILIYYLFSMDWMSYEEIETVKLVVFKNFNKLKTLKQKLFNKKKDYFFFEFRKHLIDFIFLFLSDRYILQLIHNKHHNFTNIVAFLLNESCSFQGLVYLNFLQDVIISFIKFIFNSFYEINTYINSKMLLIYLSSILNEIYNFLNEILRLFLKKTDKIKNDKTLLNFYDCLVEFIAHSKNYNNIFEDFSHIVNSLKLKKMETIVLDNQKMESLEKKMFGIKKNISFQNMSTKLSSSMY